MYPSRVVVFADTNRPPTSDIMSKKNNRKTAARRIEEAKRVEREALRKKEERRLKRMAEMEAAGGAMVVDGGSGKKRAATATAKNVRVAQSLRATGGVTKKREGKNTHKLVRGVKIGGAKLRKNSVVKGIKIVDATTKQMAIERIAEETGQVVTTSMYD